MSVSCRKSKEKPEVIILKPKSLRLQLSSLRAMLIFPKPPQQVQEIVKAEGQNQQDRCALPRESPWGTMQRVTSPLTIATQFSSWPRGHRPPETWNFGASDQSGLVHKAQEPGGFHTSLRSWMRWPWFIMECRTSNYLILTCFWKCLVSGECPPFLPSPRNSSTPTPAYICLQDFIQVLDHSTVTT